MAKKVVKAPPEHKNFSLGYRHWETDKNGIVRDLSPDDRQILELQRIFKLEIIDMPDAPVVTKPSKDKEAKAIEPQENREE